MIENFEEITVELTEEELEMIPMVIRGMSKYSKSNQIKSDEIVKRWNANSEFNMTGAKLRKMVNYIRTKGLCPIIATSSGYYVSTDKEEIKSQVKSLNQRAASIKQCADGLKRFL